MDSWLPIWPRMQLSPACQVTQGHRLCDALSLWCMQSARYRGGAACAGAGARGRPAAGAEAQPAGAAALPLGARPGVPGSLDCRGGTRRCQRAGIPACALHLPWWVLTIPMTRAGAKMRFVLRLQLRALAACVPKSAHPSVTSILV